MTIWSDEGAPVRLTGELDDLDHALDIANKVLFQGLPGESKREAMELIGRMRAKFDALDARVTTSFEVTQEHRHEGHGSVVAWAKTHLHAKGPDTARRQRTAHRLRELPKAEEALTRGQITVEHVDVLWRARQLLGPADFRIVEEPLVDSAIDLRFGDFEQTVEYVIVRAAPADADERARRDFEDRYASSSPVGSNGKVDAQMDAIGFGPWQAELERLMDHLLEEDRAEARDRLGRAPLHGELRRTTRQRRVEAMVLMARRSAAYGDDDLGPMPFTTTVHVTPEFLTALIAVLTKALNPDDDPGFDLDESLDSIELTADSLHELDDGTVITLNTVMLALLTGTVRGILYDPARRDPPLRTSPPPLHPRPSRTPSEPSPDAARIPGAATAQAPPPRPTTPSNTNTAGSPTPTTPTATADPTTSGRPTTSANPRHQAQAHPTPATDEPRPDRGDRPPPSPRTRPQHEPLPYDCGHHGRT